MNTRLRVFATLAGAFFTVLFSTGSHCNEVTSSGMPTAVPTAVSTQTPTPIPPTLTPISGPPVIASVTHVGSGGIHHGTKVDFAGIGFDTSSKFFLFRPGNNVILIKPISTAPGVVEVEIPDTAGAGVYTGACVETSFGSSCRSFLWYLTAS